MWLSNQKPTEEFIIITTNACDFVSFLQFFFPKRELWIHLCWRSNDGKEKEGVSLPTCNLMNACSLYKVASSRLHILIFFSSLHAALTYFFFFLFTILPGMWEVLIIVTLSCLILFYTYRYHNRNIFGTIQSLQESCGIFCNLTARADTFHISLCIGNLHVMPMCISQFLMPPWAQSKF